MMRWFGMEPFAPMCDDVAQEPVPIGEPCLYCGEAIASEDNGFYYSGGTEPVLHQECFLRPIVGSMGHQQGLCSCYGGTEDDPKWATKREAAKLAVEFYRKRNARP